jgi:outer membrane murein-binding lipoprotein Lpp
MMCADDGQVEHQRRLRQLAEDEAELTAQQLQLQTDRQAVAAAAGQAAIQEQVKAHNKE